MIAGRPENLGFTVGKHYISVGLKIKESTLKSLNEAVAQRRTFAIISHPDAGKTTLTEKLLLFGGAIQQAGAVKARGEQRRAHSDWMKVERERGISVTSSVMTYEYAGLTFNLLDSFYMIFPLFFLVAN